VPCRLDGTVNVAMLSSSRGSAPNRMKGRNFPHREEALSTIRPAKRSVTASQNRTRRNIVPTAAADRPTTSV